LRAVAVVAALVLLTLGSSIWRRATFRYVHDARRRRQFLILRRLATGVLTTLIIVLGFVSNFSSLATYAGLITAGIAVALQGVILSVAGYFFLIGRYGIRAGDRVTVLGVTGDVVEVGLVRFYMMELAATGVVLHPTGRLIVLPNSVLFNISPLYKQIPGTDYAWHEVAVTLASAGDREAVEQGLLAAAQAVYKDYRPALEQQHRDVEQLIDVTLPVPAPMTEVVYTDSGLDVVVRYPVDLRRMAEMDEAVTNGVQDAIRRDPKMKQGIAGSLRIRAAVKT